MKKHLLSVVLISALGSGVLSGYREGRGYDLC